MLWSRNRPPLSCPPVWSCSQGHCSSVSITTDQSGDFCLPRSPGELFSGPSKVPANQLGPHLRSAPQPPLPDRLQESFSTEPEQLDVARGLHPRAIGVRQNPTKGPTGSSPS